MPDWLPPERCPRLPLSSLLAAKRGRDLSTASRPRRDATTRGRFPTGLRATAGSQLQGITGIATPDRKSDGLRAPQFAASAVQSLCERVATAKPPVGEQSGLILLHQV